MKINSYNNNLFDKTQKIDKKNKDTVSDKTDDKLDAVKNTNNKTDKLEISNDVLKMNTIKARIDSGYYDNQQVLREVAAKILNVIDNKV
ncbi:hypothetical protein SDC9_149907 [bioreactor metagenome]|uniref:Anti-sigma-28 factor FlgM C-terminal domain-containing protein n=1 Tax=bioreactor metagenome TaxID=1076179 RepID=A0A645EL23_9ZZZZ